MVLAEEKIKKLRSAFNLNIYEVKVWTALLSKGIATAGELSEITNVPRSRAYDVLESLEKRGFIIMKLGRPIKYLAVEPEEIIKRVKKTHEEKAKREVSALDDIKRSDIFSELDLLFKQGIDHVDPTKIAGTFKGRKSIYNHIQTLISNAKKSILISTTEDGLVRKADELKSSLKKAKSTNVNIQVLAPLSSKTAKDAAKELKDVTKVNNFDVKARFIIIDDSEILMFLNNDTHESSEIAIWTQTPFFASAIISLIDRK